MINLHDESNGHHNQPGLLIGPLNKSDDMGQANPVPAVYRATETTNDVYETEQGTFWHRQTARTASDSKIANFTARITEHRIRYGIDGRRMGGTIVVALQGEALTEALELSEQEFRNHTWIKTLPFGFYVTTEIPRAALVLTRHIQQNSVNIRIVHEYSRLGLVRLQDGPLGYVTSGGTITATECRTDARVVTDLPELAWRRLPVPPIGLELQQAIRATLGFFSVAPAPISYAMMGLIFASILGRTRFSLHIAGGRDTRKTSMLRLCLSFWGGAVIHTGTPIFGWSSTTNAAEMTLKMIANGIVERDDFVPDAATSRRAANRDADRLFRAAANNSSRSRLDASGSIRPDVRMESAAISTGEDAPDGESLRARMLILDMRPGDVNLSLLTQQQELGVQNVHSRVMAAFIQELLPTIEQTQENLERYITVHRSDYASIVAHEKHADAGAHLAFGLQLFLQFAVKNGAMTQAEAEQQADRAQAALCQLLQSQRGYGQRSDPTERFRDALYQALVDGHAYFEDENGRAPSGLESLCGWQPTGGGWSHHGRRVGWVKHGQIYVDPSAAFGLIKGEQRIGVSQDRLNRLLRDRGALAQTDQDDRHATCVRLMIHGIRRQVLHLRRDWLFGEDDVAGTETTSAPTMMGDDLIAEALGE